MKLLDEIYLARIEENWRGPGQGRLGRHIEHDERSKMFAEAEGTVVTSYFMRNIPILDQGDKGSCTGNAGTGALGCDPFFKTMTGKTLPGEKRFWMGDEDDALELYHEATVNDGFSGTYPPDDTGSTGLAVAKSLQADGFVSGYTHAFSLNAALVATNRVPTIWGINWYEGFDNPDENGLVTISGDVRGGHEVCARGVDISARLVWFDNSWGTSWGKQGSFEVSWDDLDRLLGEGGDVIAFTPDNDPAPTPTPVPTPDADTAFSKALGKFWTAEKAWKAAKEL